MPHLRTATVGDLPAAADTLARAFADYAWTTWTVAPDRHLDRIRDIQLLCLEHIAMPHGLVVVNDDLTGVIALTCPSAPVHVPTEVWELIRAAAGDAPAYDSEYSLPASPVPGSWELATLGVHPDTQGAGLGTALVTHALQTLDTTTGHRTPVHLETSEPRNVDLYLRHGFTTHAETRGQGPTVWSMQRR
ncbi:GNAT family N-acetyltransferase [Corynebacterium sp.]|uniref:GNAT family N-acetyltransferase n=1 Tax=Corynebacterium sp. TaxID=1720 RepID=UPI003B3A2DEF